MLRSTERRLARILVVDDDRMMRELLTTRLELAGYETQQAEDGFEGLRMCQAVRPQAMILDIQMPRLDGFGVLAEMRRWDRARAPRVMVLTARHQSEEVRRAIALGANDFLAKPFEDAQFLARVARLTRGLQASAAAKPAGPPNPPQRPAIDLD